MTSEVPNLEGHPKTIGWGTSQMGKLGGRSKTMDGKRGAERLLLGLRKLQKLRTDGRTIRAFPSAKESLCHLQHDIYPGVGMDLVVHFSIFHPIRESFHRFEWIRELQPDALVAGSLIRGVALALNRLADVPMRKPA